MVLQGVTIPSPFKETLSSIFFLSNTYHSFVIQLLHHYLLRFPHSLVLFQILNIHHIPTTFLTSSMSIHNFVHNHFITVHNLRGNFHNLAQYLSVWFMDLYPYGYLVIVAHSLFSILMEKKESRKGVCIKPLKFSCRGLEEGIKYMIIPSISSPTLVGPRNQAIKNHHTSKSYGTISLVCLCFKKRTHKCRNFCHFIRPSIPCRNYL
jgi:hypothetical protein